MRTLLLFGFVVLTPLTQGRPPEIPFRVQMIDGGASETAVFADLNNDDRLDVVSSDAWYEAPSWTKHGIRDVAWNGQYVDNFTDLPIDVDADGWIDVVQFGYFSNSIVWMKNPGRGGGPWTLAEVDRGAPTEFAQLVDLDNDGRARELLPQFDRAAAPLNWYELQEGRWIKHTVSDRSYGHGIGAGDLNGDGRNDILTPRGWLESPADVRSGSWRLHETDWYQHPIAPSGTPRVAADGAARGPATPAAGAAGSAATPPAVEKTPAQFGFMYAVDINGDGRSDVLTSMGHDYGVCWFEQMADGSWTQRVIDNTWSQAHASRLVDLNGDGQGDFVTGKRYFAHNGADPGEREPIGLYWYEYRRPGAPSAGAPAAAGRGRAAGPVWTRHIIDYGARMGGGMQIDAADFDADGDLDIVSGGKAGLFLAENLTRPPRR